MSVRKYNIEKMTDEELAALAEKFPAAVQVITIRRPVYSVIAKLLDCRVDVPGVRLKTTVAQQNKLASLAPMDDLLMQTTAPLPH